MLLQLDGPTWGGWEAVTPEVCCLCPFTSCCAARGGVGDPWPSSQGALKTSYCDVFNTLSPALGLAGTRSGVHPGHYCDSHHLPWFATNMF